MGGDGRTYAKSRFGPSLCCNGYRKGENNGWEVREDGREGKGTYKGKEGVQGEGKSTKGRGCFEEGWEGKKYKGREEGEERDTKGREGYKGKGRDTKGRECLVVL